MSSQKGTWPIILGLETLALGLLLASKADDDDDFDDDDLRSFAMTGIVW